MWKQDPGTFIGGLAQLARAPALQAGGHRFESDILHQREVGKETGVIPARPKRFA